MKNPLRKRTRYEKAKRAVRDMMRKPTRRTRHAPELHEHPHPDYSGLHWMTAGLFVAAGTEAALGERRGLYGVDPVRWAPLIAAPLAGAAQAARALSPTPTTKFIAQLVNGVALGVGAAGVASSITAIMQERTYDDDTREISVIDRLPSLAPLAFGAVGLLALFLDSDEEDDFPVRRVVIRV